VFSAVESIIKVYPVNYTPRFYMSYVDCRYTPVTWIGNWSLKYSSLIIHSPYGPLDLESLKILGELQYKHTGYPTLANYEHIQPCRKTINTI